MNDDVIFRRGGRDGCGVVEAVDGVNFEIGGGEELCSVVVTGKDGDF